MRRLLLPALLLLASLGQLTAQSLPLVPSNAGTEFWFAAPANWNLPGSTFYYVRLYITSEVSTEVRVSVEGTVFKTITTVPYDVVTVDLSPAQAQVFVRTDTDPVPYDQIYANKAIHIEADDPIVAYCMNRTSYTSDGMLLYPTSALGREYVVSSYGAVTDGTQQELPSQMMIIAPYDSTYVTVYFPTRTQGHEAGDSLGVLMNKGDVWSAMSLGYNGDITGARIVSNLPVAVTAGQNCAYIPNTINFCCCDHIAESMLPTETWGTRYLAVPLKPRTKGEMYRIVASQPNTVVKINGVTFATLTQAGGGVGQGWVEYASGSSRLVEFTADKPISVTQYNPSAQYDGNTTTDPFMVSLVSDENFLTETVFSTPSSDFPENYLNLVCDSADWYEIEIAPGASDNWQKLSTLYGAVPKYYPTTFNDYRWMGTQIDIPPGTYRLRSPRPLAGYLYGFGPYDSYGYPLGNVMRQEGTGDTTLPTITSQFDECSGRLTVNVTDDGRSGLSAVILRDSARAFEISRTKFTAGAATATEAHAMLVQGDSGVIRVTAVDMAGNVAVQEITATRSAVSLSAAETNIAFGSVWTDSLSARLALATNTGTASIHIDSLHLSDGSRFTILGPIGPVTLLPGGKLQVDLQFRSQTPGTWQDTLTAYLSCGAWRIALLNGTSESRPVSGVLVETLPDLLSATLAPAVVSNDEATLDLKMGHDTRLRVTLVDASGAEVRELVPQRTLRSARLPLDLKGVPAGSYLVRILSNEGEAVRRLVVTR